jgi:hypothetical protein
VSSVSVLKLWQDFQQRMNFLVLLVVFVWIDGILFDSLFLPCWETNAPNKV